MFRGCFLAGADVLAGQLPAATIAERSAVISAASRCLSRVEQLLGYYLVKAAQNTQSADTALQTAVTIRCAYLEGRTVPQDCLPAAAAIVNDMWREGCLAAEPPRRALPEEYWRSWHYAHSFLPEWHVAVERLLWTSRQQLYPDQQLWRHQLEESRQAAAVQQYGSAELAQIRAVVATLPAEQHAIWLTADLLAQAAQLAAGHVGQAAPAAVAPVAQAVPAAAAAAPAAQPMQVEGPAAAAAGANELQQPVAAAAVAGAAVATQPEVAESQDRRSVFQRLGGRPKAVRKTSSGRTEPLQLQQQQRQRGASTSRSAAAVAEVREPAANSKGSKSRQQRQQQQQEVSAPSVEAAAVAAAANSGEEGEDEDVAVVLSDQAALLAYSPDSMGSDDYLKDENGDPL